MTFTLRTTCDVVNVNPRNEKHGDEEVLAIDIKCKGSLDVTELMPLFGFNVSADEFKSLFWNDGGRKKFQADHAIKFDRKLERIDVGIFESFIDKPKDTLFKCEPANLKGFTAAFGENHQMQTTFTIQCQVTEKEAGILCGLLGETVYVVAQERQIELELDETEAAEA